MFVIWSIVFSVFFSGWDFVMGRSSAPQRHNWYILFSINSKLQPVISIMNSVHCGDGFAWALITIWLAGSELYGPSNEIGSPHKVLHGHIYCRSPFVPLFADEGVVSLLSWEKLRCPSCEFKLIGLKIMLSWQLHSPSTNQVLGSNCFSQIFNTAPMANILQFSCWLDWIWNTSQNYQVYVFSPVKDWKGVTVLTLLLSK